MKAEKYLFSLWVGVLIYTVLFILFGAGGFSAQHQLEKDYKMQEENLEKLKLVNWELEEAMNSLLYDKDTLTVYAREQGYASENERFVRIVGLGVSHKNRTFEGMVQFAAEPQYIPTQTLLIIAFCSGVSVFIYLAFFDVLKLLENHRKNRENQETDQS
jgi:cell division protein FtsB